MSDMGHAESDGLAQMDATNVRRRTLVCGLLLLALLGCRPASPSSTPVPVTPTPTVLPTGVPSVGTPTPRPTLATPPTLPAPRPTTATATPRFLGDCGWRGQFYTWVDTNANGAVDAGEPPLPGVAISRENVLTGAAGTLGVTDAAGMFYHESLLGGCPVVQFVVGAQAPPGYRPTTPGRVPEDLASRQRTVLYRFGFAPLSPSATP